MVKTPPPVFTERLREWAHAGVTARALARVHAADASQPPARRKAGDAPWTIALPSIAPGRQSASARHPARPLPAGEPPESVDAESLPNPRDEYLVHRAAGKQAAGVAAIPLQGSDDRKLPVRRAIEPEQLRARR